MHSLLIAPVGGPSTAGRLRAAETADTTIAPRSLPVCAGCLSQRWTERSGRRIARLLKCETCGTWYMEAHRKGASELYETYYRSTAARRFVGPFDLLWSALRKRKALLIGRHSPPGARLLDVGCERGELLNVLRRHGFAVHGTQISRSAANYAAKTFGIDVFVGELDDAPYDQGSFDAVLMLHVLEHLPDPNGYAASVRRLLRRGGRFWVEVPNSLSLTARMFNLEWLHADPEHHFWAFSLTGLRALLDRHGFTIEQTYHWSWQHGPIGCAQSWLNAIPGPRNVLFNVATRGFSRGGLVLELFHCVLAIALLPAAMLVSGVESTTRNGQVVLVRARKAEG